MNSTKISAWMVVGWADTSMPDPYPAFCFNLDCFVSHASNGGRAS